MIHEKRENMLFGRRIVEIELTLFQNPIDLK